MVHQTKAWTTAASKAKKEQQKAELKCQGLEEKLGEKEKELADAHAQVVQLKKEKEDAIDDYMDSDDFKKLMDAHDDILLPEQHTQGWNDAFRAVLAKHPGLFAEGDFQAPFLPSSPPEVPASPLEIPLISPLPAETLALAEKSLEETPEKTSGGSSSTDGSSGSSSSEEDTDTRSS